MRADKGKAKKKRPDPATEARAVLSWNECYPIGLAVQVKMDSGEDRITFTTSKAYLLGGHSAVIWLKGITGCYALNRVTPIIA